MFQENAHHSENETNSYNQTTLSFECPTAHWYFTSPARSIQLLGQSLTGTALAIISTTHWGGMAYSEGTDF